MKQILTKITNGEVLTREQTCQIVRHIADGEYNDVQISALLTGLIMRGIKVDEVLGLRARRDLPEDTVLTWADLDRA